MSVRRWKLVPCIALAALVGLTGCSALGNSDSPPANPGPGGLEKTSLKVAIQPSVDAAPYWLAQDGGYFRAEGLDVQTTLGENPSAVRDKLLSGEADLAELTYPTFFVAVQGGADLRMVADGTSASPKSNQLITVPTSPVKSVEDLAGKRIAITARNGTSDILTRSIMRDHNVDYSQVKWVLVPLPNMAAALKDNQVDAAYQPEPFLHTAARTAGAIPLIDVAGPGSSTQDFPVIGYDAKREWTEKYPNTMAAFQRAMLKATRAANASRAAWEPLVLKYTKADEADVKLMTPPGFNSTLDERRIKRVPDLMGQLGILPGGMNVAPLIVKQVSA